MEGGGGHLVMRKEKVVTVRERVKRRGEMLLSLVRTRQVVYLSVKDCWRWFIQAGTSEPFTTIKVGQMGHFV